MDKEKIKAAKDRAQLVVDGFAKVRDQQARDVINLVDHAVNQQLVIKILENKVEELRNKLQRTQKILQRTQKIYSAATHSDSNDQRTPPHADG